MAEGYANPVAGGTSSDPFAEYKAYREELATTLRHIGNGPRPSLLDAMAHLDGLAYHRLRKDVPIETRRAYSTFFTSSTLRARLVAPYRNIIVRGAKILDPACGIGDLLLAAVNLLPHGWPVHRIASHVASNFHGRELIPVLAEVAQYRLQLAIKLAADSDYQYQPPFLPHIQAGDGLAHDVSYNDARLVLLNPPYGRKTLTHSVEWSEGLTSEAAPFTLQALERCRKGTAVAAILPDVLRSGSRYSRWRHKIESLAHIDKVEVVGLFDTWTDVDVFIVNMRVRSGRSAARAIEPANWYSSSVSNGAKITLSDVATISIGDVVPHRHGEVGPEVPYLSVHSTPIGAIVTEAPTRRFHGRLHKAPFIVVRRTSAPTRVSGGSRIASSLISSALGSVAVENHLIVITPQVGGIAACRKLMQQLGHPSVTTWLDTRLRTRHLTKQALLDLPLPGQPEGDQC
jgi:N-6 DNA Methylase